MKIKLRPIYDNIIVQEQQAPERTSGGIYIPHSAQKSSRQGIVLAVGAGAIGADKSVLRLEVKVGDKVVFGEYAGVAINIDELDLLVMKESDVLGLLS